MKEILPCIIIITIHMWTFYFKTGSMLDNLSDEKLDWIEIQLTKKNKN